MLKEILETQEPRTKEKAKFQVLFLRNDSSQQVEVFDVKRVDFSAIAKRLKQGESVFITSKSAQKVSETKTRVCRNLKSRMVTAFAFEPS